MVAIHGRPRSDPSSVLPPRACGFVRRVEHVVPAPPAGSSIAMLATSQNSIGAVAANVSDASRGRQRVEGVAALVQQRLDVALQPGGVHEDERLAARGAATCW